MDRKGDPKSIRFTITTRQTIEEIATTEDIPFTEAVEMLLQLGIKLWVLFHKTFTIRPKYRTAMNKSEDSICIDE